MKRFWQMAALGLAALASFPSGRAGAKMSDATAQCVECHSAAVRGVVVQWQASSHWGAGVGCYECHQAKEGEPDAIDHNGWLIATVVSPRDCGRCHPDEAAEQEASHHADAGNILHSKDALLGQTIGGEPAVAAGCRQCHGSIVKTRPDGTLDPATWPNTGIGRVNPDGSKGACSACHTRHRFSKAQARMPDACGKCHLGPDHPQKEVYEESKHGILYAAFKAELNLGRPKWVAGEDYFDAPTCATCHLSASLDRPATHDVGERLSWDLRAPISLATKDGDEKRARMRSVCSACHGGPFVDGFYGQFDALVELYNSKFAVPATEILELLTKEGVLTPQAFDDRIDWVYWELWHDAGRRARHGAAMSGPDYTWWHGIFDVAKVFYTELLPEAREACERAKKPEVYRAILAKYIDGDVRHEWFTKGFDPERVKEIRKYYEERYRQKAE